uniref:Uncharacterized protein n=1 Tax=Meloidogyne incognita TaxID=6306 RepID=A0A914KVY6_MELIC
MDFSIFFNFIHNNSILVDIFNSILVAFIFLDGLVVWCIFYIVSSSIQGNCIIDILFFANGRNIQIIFFKRNIFLADRISVFVDINSRFLLKFIIVLTLDFIISIEVIRSNFLFTFLNRFCNRRNVIICRNSIFIIRDGILAINNVFFVIRNVLLTIRLGFFIIRNVLLIIRNIFVIRGVLFIIRDVILVIRDGFFVIRNGFLVI